MGKTIHELAEQHGDGVVFIIDRNSSDQLNHMNRENVDVAIEFTNPESAFENLKYCVVNQIPVISGTTGWLHRYDELVRICHKNDGTFMYASNFSIGVNIFFEVNKFLAEKMSGYQEYRVSMEEIHHTEKLDAPSGTAITLAEGIVEKNSRFESVKEIDIHSKRIGKTPGTHTIEYHSPIDSIEIKHTAHSRRGFAKGAYEAAVWIKNKKGVFSIQDMLFGDQ